MMNYQYKTRKDLIKELQELQMDHKSLKTLHEKEITEHRLEVDALRENKEIFRHFMEYSPIFVFFKDKDIRSLLLSRNYETMLGKPLEELLGKNMNDLFPSDLAKKMVADDMRILKEGKEITVEEELNGRFYSTIKFPILIEGKPHYLAGFTIDITERKLAEEEIKLKNELLQTSIAEKDKFFSILAHDLRGPLSSFVAATQVLTEEIQTMDMEEIMEITGSMKTSATNIYTLLENLLEWSRLRQGGLDFFPVKLSLKKKIGECVEVLSESARKKGIEIKISIPDKLEVFADNHMFDTVIWNLVSNAIKFTHGGGTVSVTADYKSDHYIEVKISDSGIGMTPELKNKLFLLNEKTSRKGTEGEPGTGFGLLLCKEFIEKHNGKIWVESEVGKGSTFAFTMGQSENLKMR